MSPHHIARAIVYLAVVLLAGTSLRPLFLVLDVSVDYLDERFPTAREWLRHIAWPSMRFAVYFGAAALLLFTAP